MSSHIFTFKLDSANLQYQSLESFDSTFILPSNDIQKANSNHQRAPPNPYTSTDFTVISATNFHP